MNATPGSVGLSALLPSQPMGMDEVTSESPSDADFTAAMTAAVAPAEVDECTDIVGSIIPDDFQFTAALAWMVGVLSAEVPRDVTTNNTDLPVAVTAGAVPQSQLLAAEALAAAAEFAAQKVTTDADNAAPDARAALAPTLIKSAGARTGGEPNLPQAADPLDSGVPLGKVEGDHPKHQAVAAITRLLDALPDQSATRDAITPRLDASASAPTLYTNSREAYVTNAVPTAIVQEALRQPVGTPRWGAELATRLMLMSVRGQQEGSLSLTPEHLGPLEIRINVSQDTTNVWFGAQHADTRAALTDAIPRLREMLAASGLELGHAGVSHEMPRHEARQAEASALAAEGTDDSLDVTAATPTVQRLRAVLLDAWA
jgi:Flagellar hook-length control protein FliK